ncbi:MAG: hypothetical protein ACRYG8_02250 [Janthinobacterium lividum]
MHDVLPCIVAEHPVQKVNVLLPWHATGFGNVVAFDRGSLFGTI